MRAGKKNSVQELESVNNLSKQFLNGFFLFSMVPSNYFALLYLSGRQAFLADFTRNRSKELRQFNIYKMHSNFNLEFL